jgi:hypothetical protein
MYPRILFILLFPLIGIAQSPQKINFQSILRNTNGEIVANKSVSLKISILSGSISGSSEYSETHTKTTDISGLISLQIGNGTVLSGVFANIGWGNTSHFIKLEADFSGGSNYVVLGTQELMSVPYALYASKTDTSSLNLINRLAEKVNVSDTSTMLNPYLRKASIQNSTLELFGIHSWEYPEGFSKDIYFISRNDLPYTVPMGKNLYLITTGNFITINGLPYKTQSGTVFKEGTIFESFMDGPTVPTGVVPGINIFLINKTNKIVPVFFPLNCSNLTYTVPVGKLFITNGTAGNTRFIINNVSIPIGADDVYIIPEGSIIKNCGTEQPWGLNGYLIDK